MNKHVDPTGNPPKGILFHASGPIDGGWGVIDFWESRQDFDAFQPRIQAAIAAAGVEMQGPPDKGVPRPRNLPAPSAGDPKGGAVSGKLHITEVGRVAVPTDDQDRALEFYVGTLGFELPYHRHDVR